MKKIAVYGTGVIGSSWGAVFLRGGYDVTFYDISQDKLDAAKQSAEGVLNFFAAQSLITQEECDQAKTRAIYTTDVATAVTGADFIQENCPENVAIKQSVIATIEKYAKIDAIIASSTSGLLISDIAAKAEHPERIIGGHPYNPVHIMPLVEVSKSDKTSDAVVQAAREFYSQLGKEPVVMNKECPGFLCNRIQVAVAREAYDLVYRGVCSVEDIDKAIVYGLGLRWAFFGPHLVFQIGGGQGGYRSIFEHVGPATTYWLEDMAKWTSVPEGYLEIAEAGIAEEMKNRKPGTGQTNEELSAFLSGGIMTLLKYHGKL